MTNLRILAASAALLSGTAIAAPALAQGLSFSAGAAVTSNYMSRGATQSNNRAVLQFYGEVEASGFYAGVWASTVRLAPDDLEVDLYAGYRFSVGSASFDIGYARYWYDSTGDCCGELYGLVEYEVDRTTVFAGIYLDGARLRSVNDLHIGVSYQFTDKIGTSLTVGRASGGARYGILGVSYAFTDNVSMEMSYHATNQQRDQLVLSASFDF